jgi:hypothetical protein
MTDNDHILTHFSDKNFNNKLELIRIGLIVSLKDKLSVDYTT